jgi:GTP pyrophosphokinase/guanosine-3',5'-bis(diphosphate) 3'-pyrophosphohydrolase
MRTLDAMGGDKRGRIARETLDIYAPIAHRLGLNQTYRELQELSFAQLYPWRHAALAKAVAKARGTRRDMVERIQTEAKAAFSAAKLKVQIHGREKTVYSIFRKMRDKHTSFAQVSDLFGFRIVVPHVSDCYLALGVLHQLYKPVPGRFKDYIAIPKANGYQSLHTTLVSPLGTAIEFQIRTEPMHAVAEAGIAAHWMYKTKDQKGVTGEKGDDAQRLGASVLQSLLDIQDNSRDATEFLEHVKLDLFPDAVYVFTPMSRILALPRGSTPVDFAYAIHSDVGDHCVGATVNGEAVTLRTTLKSGDVVAITTAPSARPNPGWLSFVVTGRARSKIRHHLKTMEQEEAMALGEKLLAQALRAEGLALPSPDAVDDKAASLWQQLARWGGNRTRQELLVDIGIGRKIAAIVAKTLAHLMAERGMERPDALTLSMRHFGTDAGGEQGEEATLGHVIIDGSEGASIRMAQCCRPVPGDDIIGYLGRGEGLTVHTGDCGVARRLFDRDSERWLPVQWAEQPTRPFEASVAVLVENGKGVLARVASAVAGTETDITHIDMGQESAAATTELRLTLAVRDRLHLADVLRTLKRAPSVLRANRIKPA